MAARFKFKVVWWTLLWSAGIAIFSCLIIALTGTRASNPSTGHLFLLKARGGPVYVTPWAGALYGWLLIYVFVVGAVLAIIAVVVRARRNRGA